MYTHSVFKNQLQGPGVVVHLLIIVPRMLWGELSESSRPAWSTHLVSSQPWLQARPFLQGKKYFLVRSACMLEPMASRPLVPAVLCPWCLTPRLLICTFEPLPVPNPIPQTPLLNVVLISPLQGLTARAFFIREQLCDCVLNSVSQTKDFKPLVFKMSLFSKHLRFSKWLLCMRLI